MYHANYMDIRDPEKRKQRAFKIRCKFRALCRKVYRNKYWLEDMEDAELGEDVKKNILVLLRKKKGNKLLTLSDKSMLCKKAEDRTKTEIDSIFRKIGGFKCFRRYPTHVKIQLAAVSYFMYYEPGRIIVKQNQEAHALYFIIEGEVAVYQEKIDPITNEHKYIDKGTMGPGQLFGEVSLLHDIPRTATIKTLTHCEFLCLYRSDFNYILKKTLQGEWNRILDAMSIYRYFDEWDEVMRRECCIISKIVEFDKDEIVYSENVNTTHVHFLVEGSCRMIEELKISHSMIGDKHIYKKAKKDASLTSMTDSQKSTISNAFSRLVNLNQFTLKKSASTLPSKKSVSITEKTSETFSINSVKRESEALISGIIKTLEPFVEPSTLELTTSNNAQASQTQKSKNNTMNVNPKKVIISKVNKGRIQSASSKFQTIFMQVCIFNKEACFGIGENIENRCIIAITPVKILQIPSYWIHSRSMDTIWHNVKQTLQTLIPSSDEVFRIFKTNRRWSEYKRKMITSMVTKQKVNCYSNVPLSIRMQYHPDTYYPEQ